MNAKNLKFIFNLIAIMVMMSVVTGCGDSDDDNDGPDYVFAIEGNAVVTNQFSAEFKVSGVPSGASVEWGVSNDKFEVSRNGYNSGQRIFPVGDGSCQEYSDASLNMKNLMSLTPRN